MITFLIFLLVLSVLVFAHEFGHFITAKRAGLRIDEFGFGFPPRVVGIRRKTHNLVAGQPATKLWEIIWGNPKDFDIRGGGTVYSINALPIGGFVKIKGESGENQDDHDSFASRGALTRSLILVAGVTMNVALAVLVIAIGYTIGFPQIFDDSISKYADIQDRRIEVVSVLPNSPADQAGIVVGSRILTANGESITSAKEFTEFVTEFLGRPTRIIIQENQEQRDLTITPVILEETKHPGIGVAILDIGVARYPVWIAIPKAFELAGRALKAIVLAIGGLIKDAILGKPVGVDLAGPVGIAVMSGQAARQGFVYLLQFIAILSLNLAVLNILPFPALDGGRILFIAIEKIIRRSIPRRVEGWIHAVGFGLLIFLVLLVTVKDIGRYAGGVIETLKNFAR